MSSTRGVRTLVGVALASSVILLGGCSSSGTVGAGKSGGTTGGASAIGGSTGGTSGGQSSAPSKSSSSSSSDDSGSTGGTSSSSSDDSGSTGGSSSGGLGGSDAGCQAATNDVASGSNLMSQAGSDPAKALAGIKSIGDNLHKDAGKSSDPKVAAAINKVGDDYVNLAAAAGAGKQPDTGSLMTDVTAMTTACGL